MICKWLKWWCKRHTWRAEMQNLRTELENLRERFQFRLDAVYAILKALKMKLWVPEAPVVVYYEEESMAQRIHFDVRLHLPTDADVVSRLVTVKVTGTDSTVRVLYDGAVDPRTEVLGRYWGYEDEVVTVTLVDVDDAGNHSEAVEVSYQLPDLTAPAKPVAPEIVVVGTDSDFPPPVDVPSSDEPQSSSGEGQLEEEHTSAEGVGEVSPEASESVDEVSSEVSEEVVTEEHVEEEHVEPDVGPVDEQVDEILPSDVEGTDEHVDEVVADEGDTQVDDEDEQR